MHFSFLISLQLVLGGAVDSLDGIGVQNLLMLTSLSRLFATLALQNFKKKGCTHPDVTFILARTRSEPSCSVEAA